MLPAVRGSDLDLYFVDDPQAMERSDGISVSQWSCKHAANHREINLILVPGVAFSRKGDASDMEPVFYDRLLARTGCGREKWGSALIAS